MTANEDHISPVAGARLLQKAIEESRDGGLIDGYFHTYSCEPGLRRGFDAVRRALVVDGPPAVKQFEGRLKDLNREYKTRARLEDIPSLAACIVGQCNSRGWLTTNPPALFEASDSEIDSLSEAVAGCLEEMRAMGRKRPYSLATKALHFLFPGTFAIYDSRATLSIWIWSLFADPAGLGDEGFSVAQVSREGGLGYKGLLKAYQAIWTSCPESSQEDARRATAPLEQLLGGARVTILDLIDKLLWLAEGNPIRLGLAVPLR